MTNKMMSYENSDNIDNRNMNVNNSGTGSSEMNTSNSSDESINIRLNNNNNNNNEIDNNGNNTSRINHRNGLTKAEIRKNNKPIMEKKRRARINHCLNELKSLILDAMKKDPARHSKLEKADILEMTVKHLQDVQRQQIAFATLDPTVMHKFKTGFSDCADEVGDYIRRIEGIDTGVKQRLITHLHSCINNMESSMPISFGGGLFNRSSKSYRGFGGLSLEGPANSLSATLTQDVNNNGRMQMNGVQLIPSRLPTGELALVMPNSNNLPFFAQSYTPTNCFDIASVSRPSAFNTVTKSGPTRPLVSPPLSPVSSLSSFDDHTLDFTASRTPPPQHQFSNNINNNFSNVFPTPPSGGSIGAPIIKSNYLPSPAEAALQPHQQHYVSSTTEFAKALPHSSLLSVNVLQHNQINLKRTHWEAEASENLLDTIKKEPPTTAPQPDKLRKLNDTTSSRTDVVAPAPDNDGQDNMWRPW